MLGSVALEGPPAVERASLAFQELFETEGLPNDSSEGLLNDSSEGLLDDSFECIKPELDGSPDRNSNSDSSNNLDGPQILALQTPAAHTPAPQTPAAQILAPHKSSRPPSLAREARVLVERLVELRRLAEEHRGCCTPDHRLNGLCNGGNLISRYCANADEVALAEAFLTSAGAHELRENSDLCIRMFSPLRIRRLARIPERLAKAFEETLQCMDPVKQAPPKATALSAATFALPASEDLLSPPDEEDLFETWEEDALYRPGRRSLTWMGSRLALSARPGGWRADALSRRYFAVYHALPIWRDLAIAVDFELFAAGAGCLRQPRIPAKMAALFLLMALPELPQDDDPSCFPTAFRQLRAAAGCKEQTLAVEVGRLALQRKHPVNFLPTVLQRPLGRGSGCWQQRVLPRARHSLRSVLRRSYGNSAEDAGCKSQETFAVAQDDYYESPSVKPPPDESLENLFGDDAEVKMDGEPTDDENVYALLFEDKAPPRTPPTTPPSSDRRSGSTILVKVSSSEKMEAVADADLLFSSDVWGGGSADRCALLRRLSSKWRRRGEIDEAAWDRLLRLTGRLVEVHQRAASLRRRRGRNAITRLEDLRLVNDRNSFALPSVIAAAVYAASKYLKLGFTLKAVCDTLLVSPTATVRVRTALLATGSTLAVERGFTVRTEGELVALVDRHWDGLL